VVHALYVGQNNMTTFERTICLTASLAVIGGLLGIPTAIVRSGELFFLILPFIFHMYFMIMAYEGHVDRSWKTLTPATIGLWVGVGVSFHIGKGIWDLQGIPIAIIGWTVSNAVVIITRKIILAVFQHPSSTTNV
jgi:hypothetical protein